MPIQRRAVVVGFDYHARYLARVMNEHSQSWHLEAFSGTRLGTLRALWALRDADALVCFGGPGPNVALAGAALRRGVPVVVIWAGSDVVIAAENPFDFAVVKRRGYVNTAVAPWLVDELRVLGVEATFVPVGAVLAGDPVAPMPARFRAVTYLPEPRRVFYGEERVYAIARAMPEIEFVVLGSGQPNPNAPRNVTFAGYVNDVPAQLDAATVLLRLTDHDGTSVLVLEALARARHVVWTHALPGVDCVRDTREATDSLRRLHHLHVAGKLEPNATGRAYVAENYAPHDIAARIESKLNAVIDARARNGSARQRRAAISGLGLFSAEVAEQVERLHPDWRVEMLRTNSRLEVLSALASLARADVWYSIGSPVTDRWVHLLARILRKPRVIHWVGSDIETYRNATGLHKQLRAPQIRHLTEAPWTADELRGLGIDSDIAALPLRNAASGVKPLPERFTVMLYLPKARPDFYGKREYETAIAAIADERPRVLVVGGGTLRVPEGVEVVNLGWRGDLRDIYERSTVLIRLTPRDGLSLMVLEALSFGRYVMWSKPFPYASIIRDASDITAKLRSLLARHRAGRLNAQYAAAEMVERHYSTDRSVDKILESWESVGA